MPKARRSSYNMAFKLKVVAEAEAVENNSEIAREYGLSESMVRRWRKDQAKLFNGELKMSAKRTTMGRFTPKFPELDQQILEWFTEQREQGEYFLDLNKATGSLSHFCVEIVFNKPDNSRHEPSRAREFVSKRGNGRFLLVSLRCCVSKLTMPVKTK